MNPPMINYSSNETRAIPSTRNGAKAAGMSIAFFVLWTILGAGLLFGAGGAAVNGLGEVPAAYVLTACCLALISVATLARGTRRISDLAVLHYLEQAVRLNLPLPQMLRAAASNERRAVHKRLTRLRARLEDGWPVADALKAGAPGLPPRILGLIAAGDNTGRLAQSLRRVVNRRDDLRPPNPANRIIYTWYPILPLGVCALIVVFLVPKYNQILNDFHLPMPPVLVWLTWISDWLGAVILCLVVAGLSIFLGRMLRHIFTSRRESPDALRVPFDWLLWNLPVARGVIRNRGLADACHVIADALQAGMGLESGIDEAAGVKNNVMLELRLRRWSAALNAGAPMADAARSAGMPHLLAGMLATAKAGDDTPEVFRFLARYYETRFSRSAVLLRGAVVPGVAIGFGALVCAIALSIFQPLIALMESLSAGMGGM